MSPPRVLLSLHRARWRGRIALALSLAVLLIGGALHARPVDAHGTGTHYLTMTGWYEITDEWTTRPTICQRTFTMTITLRRSGPAEDRRTHSSWCGSFQIEIKLMARLRDDKKVYNEGIVLLKEENCIVTEPFCWTGTRASKSFRADLHEDTVLDHRVQVVDANGVYGSIRIKPKFIVDGPDDPAMPRS